MSQDFTPNPAASESRLASDSFFTELDQSLDSLWQTELGQYSHSVQQVFTQPTHSQARQPRKQRSRKSPLFKSTAAAQATGASKASRPVKPAKVSAPALPKSPIRPVRRQAVKPQAPSWLKAAGVAAGVMGLSLGSYQWVQASHSNHELPPLRQVMYQNAQTKVAAFRKEIEDGEYYVAPSDHPIDYTAQPGDTVTKISQKFHVSPNTIVKNNDRSKLKGVIEPGTKLSILPINGIVHPVAKEETLAELSKRYHIGIQDIVDANQLDNPHMITENQRIIIPNATELRRRPEPKPALRSIHDAGTGHSSPLVKGPTGRRLSWPTAGIVSSGFGWRWFRMHTGMDIAGPVGTPVKAAKEGRVTYAGWMGGYGYCIDIDHGNGITTRYGHNSSLQVQVGQYVSRGQVISAMGSTGHSTGPHLHFEVRINNEPMDPRGYF